MVLPHLLEVLVDGLGHHPQQCQPLQDVQPVASPLIQPGLLQRRGGSTHGSTPHGGQKGPPLKRFYRTLRSVPPHASPASRSASPPRCISERVDINQPAKVRVHAIRYARTHARTWLASRPRPPGRSSPAPPASRPARSYHPAHDTNHIHFQRGEAWGPL